MTDQSRGGSYIDDGNGPVHVDDLPKVEPVSEVKSEVIEPVIEPTVQETTDV
jgi:hypothetical protein